MIRDNLVTFCIQGREGCRRGRHPHRGGHDHDSVCRPARGLTRQAEAHGRRTVIYLRPGLTAEQRRLSLRRARQSARMGYGPRLPGPGVALAVARHVSAGTLRNLGAAVRRHPIGFTLLSAGFAGLMPVLRAVRHGVRPADAGPGPGACRGAGPAPGVGHARHHGAPPGRRRPGRPGGSRGRGTRTVIRARRGSPVSTTGAHLAPARRPRPRPLPRRRPLRCPRQDRPPQARRHHARASASRLARWACACSAGPHRRCARCRPGSLHRDVPQERGRG